MDQVSALSQKGGLRDLPLFVKLLMPFLVLLLVIGAGGLYLVVHDLSSRSRTALNEELLRRSLDARSRIHDRELYLLESVNFAANLRGMVGALTQRDTSSAENLLRSVLALKTDIQFIAALDDKGETVAAYLRESPGNRARRWKRGPLEQELVRDVLRTRDGEKKPTFSDVRGSTYLTIATPVCARARRCIPRGVVLVGVGLDTLAREAGGGVARPTDRRPTVSIYGKGGSLLATSHHRFALASLEGVRGGSIRRSESFEDKEIETLYSPLEIRGQRIGTLAVGLDAELAHATVRGSATRLALLFFLAIAGVVGIGLLLTRYLLGQVRPLVQTSRRIGQGDLAARVPIVGRDELGELAGVLNGMAEELQASHETLERRVEERTEQVQRLLVERTEFFTGISHELRTPIAVILSEARMLIDPEYEADRGPVGEAAQTISASAEQLLTRVNDILDLARAESGRLEMKVTDVPLRLLLIDLAPAIEARTAANDLSFSLEAPEGLPVVRTDRGRLQDVISNLVDNAIKYTPSGGSVALAATVRVGKVAISVSDTGVGIPADVGDRIFEPFFQIAGTRAQHGEPSSGLGLALAKRAIDALGGEISYVSVIDAGTTFTVELPLTNTEAGRSSNGSSETQTDRRYVRTASTRR